MVEIFKTNVEKQEDADPILQQLKTLFPNYRCNFDLDDCDKILRIEGGKMDITKIEEILKTMGFDCKNLN
jgi:hypothetical protein